MTIYLTPFTAGRYVAFFDILSGVPISLPPPETEPSTACQEKCYEKTGPALCAPIATILLQ